MDLIVNYNRIIGYKVISISKGICIYVYIYIMLYAYNIIVQWDSKGFYPQKHVPLMKCVGAGLSFLFTSTHIEKIEKCVFSFKALTSIHIYIIVYIYFH